MQPGDADLERTVLSAAEAGPALAAEWLKSLVIPRPIAWVGSQSAEGITNLAPHSFFILASSEPPILAFASEKAPQGDKDTVNNIAATGDFTVSLVTAENHLLANRTSAELPPEQSEFDHAGVKPLASTLVRAPGAAQSPAVMECRLLRMDPIGSATMVYGEVVCLTVRPDVLTSDLRGRLLPDPRLIRPVARLGRNEWAHLGRSFRSTGPGRPRRAERTLDSNPQLCSH